MAKSKATLKELMAKAREIADARPKRALAVEVADEKFQIIGNVAHMHWFRVAIAVELTNRHKKWSHLKEEAEQQYYPSKT